MTMTGSSKPNRCGHPELEELSALTAGKLRSNVFKAMSEAELWEKESDTLLPSLLSKS